MRIINFAGSANDASLLPALTAEAAKFESDLGRGVLALMACDECSYLRLPGFPVCPACASSAVTWRALSGLGQVYTWVRYHRAYVPEFEPLVPYCVLCVQLDEGPRLFGRFLSADSPTSSLRVAAVAERWPESRYVVAFEPTGCSR